MPIRLRITLLFALAVLIILGIVCAGIYYFSESSREKTVRKRLTNRAITMERFMTQDENFDRELLRRIDSTTTMSLVNKSFQVYNDQNSRVYGYFEIPGDSIPTTPEFLERIRRVGREYFDRGNKEVIAYYSSEKGRLIICSAIDADGKATLHRLKLILIVSFIGGTGISLIGGWLVSRRLMRPVKEITSEVMEISAHNLDRRIEVGTSRDEWYELSTTLNELLDRLKESFETQRRFIANASHELSTPLTLISSQLDVSLQRARSEEEYRRVMKSVLQDVHHMNNLVQTLLKFATASGNEGGLDIAEVRMDEVLMRLPAAIQKTDKSFSVSLSFGELPEDENRLLVWGNEELLFLAIRNIAVNGCKYSPEHHARVSLKMDVAGITITVEDNGIGMEKRELENIFQPFYRIPGSNVKGFGLGLSLAHRIVKLHKGSINVISEPQKGTKFSIILPAAKK